MTSGRKGTKLATVIKEGLPGEKTLNSQFLVASDKNSYQTLSRTEILLTQECG